MNLEGAAAQIQEHAPGGGRTGRKHRRPEPESRPRRARLGLDQPGCRPGELGRRELELGPAGELERPSLRAVAVHGVDELLGAADDVLVEIPPGILASLGDAGLPRSRRCAVFAASVRSDGCRRPASLAVLASACPSPAAACPASTGGDGRHRRHGGEAGHLLVIEFRRRASRRLSRGDETWPGASAGSAPFPAGDGRAALAASAIDSPGRPAARPGPVPSEVPAGFSTGEPGRFHEPFAERAGTGAERGYAQVSRRELERPGRVLLVEDADPDGPSRISRPRWTRGPGRPPGPPSRSPSSGRNPRPPPPLRACPSSRGRRASWSRGWIVHATSGSASCRRPPASGGRRRQAR